MKKLTQFKLDFDKNHSISGEYEGNEKTGKVVIFSHGFGMKKDSRGFFTELGNNLKDDFLVVRFDYCKMLPKENATITYSFSDQAAMLRKIVSYIKSKFNLEEIDIIAHSMGCLVAGIADLENISKTILLCSPPSTKIRVMQDYFSHKPGTEFDLEGISKVKRSDGSWTFIHPDFWSDLKSINPPELIKNLSTKSNVYFIRALQDDVIKNETYEEIKSIQEISYIELPGDHNFKGNDRKILLDQITKILN